jgi:hypothetical protein
LLDGEPQYDPAVVRDILDEKEQTDFVSKDRAALISHQSYYAGVYQGVIYGAVFVALVAYLIMVLRKGLHDAPAN